MLWGRIQKLFPSSRPTAAAQSRRRATAAAELPDSGSSSAELRGRPARRLQTDPTGRAVAAPKLRAAPGAAGRLLARHAEDEPGAMLGEIRLRLVDPRLHGDGALPAVQAALHRVSHADAQRALLAAKQRAAVSTAPAPRDARPRPGALCEPLPRAAAPIPLRRLFLLRLSGPRCGLSSPRHTPARGPARPSVGRDEAAGSVPNNGSGALPRLGLPTRLCHKPAGAARLPAELRPRRDRRRHTEPSGAQETPGIIQCNPDPQRPPRERGKDLREKRRVWRRPGVSSPTAGAEAPCGADKAQRCTSHVCVSPAARWGVRHNDTKVGWRPHFCSPEAEQGASQGSAISSPLVQSLPSFIPYEAFAKAAPWSAG